MPLKYNPFTQQYEQAEADMEPTYNELERRYEYGYADRLSYGYASGRYSKKGNPDELEEKFNPHTGQYELVPRHWQLVYNPHSGRYEYGPGD